MCAMGLDFHLSEAIFSKSVENIHSTGGREVAEGIVVKGGCTLNTLLGCETLIITR